MTLRRSKLFSPGSRPDMMAKAAASAADMLVFDLEDGVRPEDKAAARAHVRTALATLDCGRKERGVRINGLDSAHWLDDLTAVFCFQLDALHLPKVNGPREVWIVDAILADLERKAGRPQPVRLIPTLETPEGIQNAKAIATASPRVAALQFGLGDLTARLGLAPAAHRLAYFRTTVVLAAEAAGIGALDTVFFDIRDAEGYRADALEARGCGMRGKSCIHPSQVALANESFSPTAQEIARSRAVLEALENASAGAVAVGGQMVDRPVAEAARRVLAQAAELGLIPREEW